MADDYGMGLAFTYELYVCGCEYRAGGDGILALVTDCGDPNCYRRIIERAVSEEADGHGASRRG